MKSLPSFDSWVKALRLAIPTFLGANILFAFDILLCTYVLFASPNNRSTAIIFLLLLISISFIWYLTLHVVYSLLLKLLWKDAPKPLTPPTRVAILSGFLIGTFSSLLTVLLYSLIFSVSLSFGDSFTRTLFKFDRSNVERIYWMSVVWIPITAYLYHLPSLFLKVPKSE